MDKIIDINSLMVYKETVKKLEKNGIQYDKTKLIGNAELCQEVLVLLRHINSTNK